MKQFLRKVIDRFDGDTVVVYSAVGGVILAWATVCGLWAIVMMEILK